jgi:hypothetical protein
MKDKRIPHCRRGSILKSNIKNVERGKIDATNTQIHDTYKGKVKTHKYINRQNQSTTGKL